jgi:hypothetical protein
MATITSMEREKERKKDSFVLYSLIWTDGKTERDFFIENERPSLALVAIWFVV